jgi:hypothetical protein
MPTPFMHLQCAEQIRSALEADPGDNGHLPALLRREWPAFYLGSVAADFPSISGTPRVESHFYDMPPPPQAEAHATMLAMHPELAESASLPPDQAVFVAAYSAHLMLDMLWFRQILMPYFIEAPHLGNRQQRRLVHFILLAYLDTLALASLPDAAGATLAAAEPRRWLPFVDDAVLARWRNMLVAQLQPGAPVQTVEIYADRLQMSPAEFAANLRDRQWMEANVFSKVPLAEIQAKLATAVPGSIALISEYLNGD